MRKHTLIPIVFFLMIPGLVVSQQTTEEYFRQNCYSCHTIGGGRITGPDLKNVTDRQSRDWLVDFIMNPQQVINSGDPYAQKILQEARGVVMPVPQGITRNRAEALLDFIAEESQKEESEFQGMQISDRPLTQADVRRGRQLFLGEQTLQNGGPTCISCHTVNGYDGMLGGGTLGPNLTGAIARLGGRNALSSWLVAPATPTMRTTFQNAPLAQEEVLPLVAYMQAQAQQNQQQRTAPFVNYLLFGVGGAVLLLVSFDFLWGHRFRAVRKPLVERSKKIRQDLQD